MPWVLLGWVLSGLSAEGLSHPGGPVAPGNCRDDGGPHAGILPFATTTVPDSTSNPDKAPTAEWLRCQPRYGLRGGLHVGPSDSELRHGAVMPWPWRERLRPLRMGSIVQVPGLEQRTDQPKRWSAPCWWAR